MAFTISKQAADRLKVVLDQALAYMAHYDSANAAVRMAPVRYSPLTFRLAEQLEVLAGAGFGPVPIHCELILADRGKYAEDPGR